MVKPLVLIVLDGWGLAPPGPGNAISQASLSNIPHYSMSYPHTELAASGEAVGLPYGEDGNTETGHINIGAGRVVYQDLPRINLSVADGSFFTNDAFLAAIRYAQNHRSNLHMLGLMSDAGVHANREHLYALLDLVSRQKTGAPPVYLHLFTDGRDAPPKSAIRFLREVENHIHQSRVGSIATIMGRYYAMDRDRRWERTQRAYRALTEGTGRQAVSPEKAIDDAYTTGVTDEFIEPTIILDKNGKMFPRISDNDAVIFFNFRIDRPRQLTRAFILPNFETHTTRDSFDPYAVKYYAKHLVVEDTRKKPFVRTVVLQNLFFVTMTEYEKDLPCTVAYPPVRVPVPLGKVLTDAHIRQLRVAETEKERFVGYYFNGMREDPYPGEDRLIVPSPKVATYDLKPEMSSLELTDKVIDRLSLGVYGFMLINFANPDMVAHTGNIGAAIKACEATDVCVGRIMEEILRVDGACIITGDHGNVEEMLGADGGMDTEHSTFPVPFMVIAKRFLGYPHHLPKGKLADVAPTLLCLLGLAVPPEMTGVNLLADFIQGGKT